MDGGIRSPECEDKTRSRRFSSAAAFRALWLLGIKLSSTLRHFAFLRVSKGAYAYVLPAGETGALRKQLHWFLF